MSQIRCIYHPVKGKATQPDFPATDQHPDAVRYLLGLYYIDAIGGKPTQEELDAALNPPAAQPALSDGKLADLLVSKNLLTQQEVDEAAGNG